MYKYWGFGLTIASEIEFPELLPFEFEGEPDVNIRFGVTPPKLSGDHITHKVGVSISPAEYLLRLLNIANYYACNGNSIIIEPLQDADDKSVRLFLLTGVMAALLKQRNMVQLNASVVEYSGGVIVFCGMSNSGKSAIAFGLQQKGYKLFSDNTCVLYPGDNGQVMALPSYPAVSIWADTFEHLGVAISNEKNRIRPGLAKYSLYHHEDFDIQPKPVKQIFVMNKQQVGINTEMKKLGAVETFSEVHNNIYHRLQLYAMKKEAVHFSVVGKLTAALPSYLVTWVKHEETIENTVNRIITQIKSNG